MNYIIGKIVYVGNNFVILENNFIGYKIMVSNTETFELEKYKKLFLYEKFGISNNVITKEIYGFCKYKDKMFFDKLNTLPGVGPKTAFNIMKNDLNTIKSLILSKDEESLSKMNSINQKIANQMILNIKVDEEDQIIDNKKNYKEDVISVLKSLGYKQSDINNVISSKYSDADFFLKNEDELTDMISNVIKDFSINV